MKKYLFILFIAAFSMSINLSFAQITFYNNATLHIANNSILTVDDFINVNSIENNGEIIVYGNWSNSGNYNSTSGTVTFNSSSEQNINHNNGTFQNIIIDGGGSKVLNSPISISNSIVFNDGLVFSTEQNSIHLSQTAQNPSGNNNSHIVGPFFSAVNDNELIFPVGNGDEYMPLKFFDVSAFTGEIGVEVRNESVNGIVNDSLIYISNDRYWKITNDNIPLAKVSLPFLNETIPFEGDNEKLVVAQGNTSGSNFQSLGGVINGGFVDSDNLVSQSHFAIGRERLFELLIRNFISKNSDGINDILEITNIDKIEGAEIIIINQLGIQVLKISVDDLSNGNLETLSKGNYICIIKLSGKELAREIVTFIN